MTNKLQQIAFSLLELIIVVFIASLLVATAIPTYFNYIATSQITVALASISSAKLATDLLLINGIKSEISGSDYGTLNTVGLVKIEQCSSIMVNIKTSGEATVTCVLYGTSKISNKTLQLSRRATVNADIYRGEWECLSDLDESIRPKACTGTYTP